MNIIICILWIENKQKVLMLCDSFPEFLPKIFHAMMGKRTLNTLILLYKENPFTWEIHDTTRENGTDYFWHKSFNNMQWQNRSWMPSLTGQLSDLLSGRIAVDFPVSSICHNSGRLEGPWERCRVWRYKKKGSIQGSRHCTIFCNWCHFFCLAVYQVKHVADDRIGSAW